MFIINHAAIGALLGEALPAHPLLAGLFSFGIHFISDAIPHGDTNLYKGYVAGTKVKKAIVILSIDVVAAILFTIYLFSRVVIDHRAAVIMGVVGGVLPDLLVALDELFHLKALHWFHRLHFYFHNLINHRTGDLSLRTGMIMETVLLTLLLIFVL
jgi:hypothetical protein